MQIKNTSLDDISFVNVDFETLPSIRSDFFSCFSCEVFGSNWCTVLPLIQAGSVIQAGVLLFK